MLSRLGRSLSGGARITGSAPIEANADGWGRPVDTPSAQNYI